MGRNSTSNVGFKEQVYEIVRQIPRGRVMSYGQIAALAGSPRAARQVGQVAHWGPMDLPWQRVVNKTGGLAGGYTTGGREAHKRDLEAEGVEVNDYRVDVDNLIWWPEPSSRGDSSTKLVAIVGPTASGKSALAMSIAERYNGEIICADSRTVYRYMDIGTAKPTREEMLQIKHHLVDIKDPGEPFSAAEFKQLANEAIADIQSRGKLPLLVGGTGLYVDSVLYDYQFAKAADQKQRDELSKLSLEELVARLNYIDPALAETIDISNPRRVIRAIETVGQERGRSNTLKSGVLIIGIAMDKETIRRRVTARVKEMLGKGFLDEVKTIGEKFGFESEALTGIGYRAFKDVVLGTKLISEASDEFIKGDMNLAKRQMTWFKRDKNIHWVKTVEEAAELVENLMVRSAIGGEN